MIFMAVMDCDGFLFCLFLQPLYFMRLNLRVIPNASRSEIIVEDGENLRLKVQVPPADGRANRAVIQLLAQHFNVPKNRVKIIAGEKSHRKIIEILDLPNGDSLNK
jgi:uncharacterized protein (TIGR00251 family)